MKKSVDESEAARAAEETARLALECAASGALPYATEEPLPRDMNMATGLSLSDFNKARLELFAAKVGAKDTRWVFEEDARALGLSGASGEPLPIYGAVDRGKGPELEVQGAYLLDQFPPAEVAKALAGKGETALSRNFIKNYSEYDSGARQEAVRAAMRLNAKANFSPDSPSFQEAAGAYKRAVAGLSENEKFLFDYMNARYVRQACGLKMAAGMDSPAARERAAKALEEAAKKGGALLSEILSEAFFYSERTLRLGFSPEKGYGAAEEKTLPLPSAAEFKGKEREREGVSAGKKIKVLRDRDRTLRPTHSRG